MRKKILVWKWKIVAFLLSKVDPDHHDFEELLDAISCALLRSNTTSRDAHDGKLIALIVENV